MIVRTLDEIQGTDRDVAGDGWRSRRLLLAADGMGFSLHDTTVAAGEALELEYRHHLEACYVVAGEATLTDHASGATFSLGPGAAYALDRNDRHRLEARTDMRLVCVFNPALTGRERHVGGGYEPSDG